MSYPLLIFDLLFSWRNSVVFSDLKEQKTTFRHAQAADQAGAAAKAGNMLM